MTTHFHKALVLVGLIGLGQMVSMAQTPAAAKKTGLAPAAKTAEPAKATPAASTAAPASKSSVNLGKSSVIAIFKQTGVASESTFHKFTVKLDYDPAKVAETAAQVEVDLTSFDLGDAQYNAEILKKEWFNTAQFPKGSFVSTSVKAAGAGKLDVAGKLTLKGKTLDVTMPVTYKQDGANTVFEGLLPIKRLAFNIGEGEWKDTSVVEDEVKIKFKITVVSK